MATGSPVTGDGNWRLVVLFASFAINILIMAISRCTGVLFTTFQNEFMSTASQTGAISSIMIATSDYGSTIGGVLVNRFGCRRTAIVGGVLHTIGMIGGALSQNIYQMYVTGAVAGFGIGISFTPAVFMVAQYFQRYYTLATAFMTTGDSVGMLLFPPMMQLLLDTYGWRGTLLITGAITANICVAGAVYRPPRRTFKNSVVRLKNKTPLESDHVEQDESESQPGVLGDYETSTQTFTRNRFSPSVFLARAVKLLRLNLLCQSYRFTAYCFSKAAFLGAYGCFLVYIIPRATTSGIPDQRAVFLISIVGITSIVGRVLCGLVNQKVSSVVIYQASMFGCACSTLVTQGDSHAYFIASTVILGVAIGFQQAIEVVMVREFIGVENMGSAVGIYYGIGGVVDILGPILAGALFDATESYSLLFYVFAGTFFLGFLVILLAPILRRIEPGVYTKVDTEMSDCVEQLV